MVRLIDIAKEAGVSVMTVSKALRNAPDISENTKNKIKSIAERLGYVPNTLAQGLRNRKTRLLGLVISAVTNPYFARLVMAIEEKAYDLGYDLLIAQTYNNIEREEKVVRRFILRQIEGLLISPVYRFEPIAQVYNELASSKIPTVILGHTSPFCEQFPSVATDDIYCSYTATKHLLELGHKRIAFFSGPPAAPWARERLNGYLMALKDYNIEPDEKLIFTAGSKIEDGYNTAKQLHSENIHFTAIQSVNDPVAIGAINFLLENNYKIPEQVSVVGFGDILLSEHFKIPLTTINQPKYRLGIAAISLMNEILAGKKPNSITLKGELVIRKSTAPLK
ncbi:MAG: LacI family DNA-binding transcriptional regulator [Verrucomicrobiia bacterium]|jgi:LacI family transcriptional regulator